MEDLPTTSTGSLLAQAEEALVGYATDFDPVALARLAAHVLTLIAPQVGEEIDRKRLEAARTKAAQKRRLTLAFDAHGVAHGRFTIPEAQGRMLQKLLLAFAAPGHVNCTPDPGSSEQTGEKRTWVKGRPSAVKMGEAFCELIETYPRDTAPKLGRIDGTFLVTFPLDSMLTGLGTATLDDGTPISAAQATRLACEARIIPVVLGGKGEVLHPGRARRGYTAAQTYAMHARDQGCTARGCDWPPGLSSEASVTRPSPASRTTTAPPVVEERAKRASRDHHPTAEEQPHPRWSRSERQRASRDPIRTCYRTFDRLLPPRLCRTTPDLWKQDRTVGGDCLD